MTRFLVAVVLVLGSVPGWAADVYQDLGTFTPEQQKTLATEGMLAGSGRTLEDLKLWQRIPAAAGLRSLLGEKPSTLASEAVFLLDRPTGTDLERQILSAVTAVSTMKGLQVYSDSQKKMETFVFDSYRVGAPGSQKPLADPEVPVAAAPVTFTVYQKEEQAGDVYSQMTVDRSSTTVTVRLTNLTTVSVLGIPFVEPGRLSTVFVIIPLETKVALVAVTVADTARLFGLETLKQKSFYYRLIALCRWFDGNLQHPVRRAS